MSERSFIMADTQRNFNQEIIKAVEDKEIWYNTVQLPKVQENYRLHLTCVRNLFDAMVKTSLITPDPYKNDKKVTEIVCPDSSSFADNERSLVLGMRLSDYESMIDYICNYMRFTTDQLSPEVIAKLLQLNETFGWGNSATENKPNSKALANTILQLKQGAHQLVLSLIQDSTSKSAKALREINEILKDLADFQKERYKAEIRKNIFNAPDFDKGKAYSSTNALFSEIKKFFSKYMKNRSFNSDLVNALVAEELDSDAQEKKLQVLKKLTFEQENSSKKTQKIDTKELIMDVVRIMGTLNESYLIIFEKISSNHRILQDEKKSLGYKIARFFRKMFGIPEPDVEYEIILVDKSNESQKREKLFYNQFVTNLNKRVKYYASFTVKNSPGYNRILAQDEKSILDFVNRHITENNHLFAQLTAFDAYFKKHVHKEDKSKIRGILIELTTVKNILVKVRQLRAEYLAYIEEQEQMKKLGIFDQE